MINFRGKNAKAVGWLQPEWEVNSSGGAGRAEKPDENKPPTLTFESAAVRGVLPEPVTLTGSFVDDGLPKPSTRKTEGGGRKQPVGQETPPILQPSESTVEAPVNLPELPLGLRGARVGPRPPPGPSVRYTILARSCGDSVRSDVCRAEGRQGDDEDDVRRAWGVRAQGTSHRRRRCEHAGSQDHGRRSSRAPTVDCPHFAGHWCRIVSYQWRFPSSAPCALLDGTSAVPYRTRRPDQSLAVIISSEGVP